MNVARISPMALLAMLIAAGTGPVFAQAPNAQITGRITDSSEAVIADASVTVVDVERRLERTAQTNEYGIYRVPFLNPGSYRILVQKTGFKPISRTGIKLEVDQTARLDFVMEVGAVSETVEVVASANLIESEKTDIGQVIDQKRIVEMPLNGRNYLELAQLSAGVLPGSRARSGPEGNFSANGTAVEQTNVLLDGNDNSSRQSGGPIGWQAQAVKPPVDAVDEFKVVTDSTSAEYGYRIGAKVLVSTKAGTNDFHGSLYEFLRNDKLDGTNFFANRSGAPKPPYRQNQFGATLGGPVIRNRTFFFASYQSTRIRIGDSTITSVPSAQVLQGDFSLQPETRRNVYDPLTIKGSGANAVRLPFPGNRIPLSRFDPVAQRVAGFYPAPNIAGRENLPNNYFIARSSADDANQYDFRVDHNFSDTQHTFIRYSARRQNAFDPGVFALPADGGSNGAQSSIIDGDNVVLNHSSTLSPTAYNQFRLGYSRFPARFDIPYSENLNKKFGIKGAPGDSLNDGQDYGWSVFAPGGFNDLGSKNATPNTNDFRNWLLADSLLLQRGKHSIKIGGEFRRLDLLRKASKTRRGSFQFSGVYTAEKPNSAPSRANSGNGMADMLLGMASGGTISNWVGEEIVTAYYGGFVQDDWKVTPGLTLNLGLRWEFFRDPTFPDPKNQLASRYLIAGVNNVTRAEEHYVFPKDGGDCGCDPVYNNFAPRLGLAYRLNDNTVLRAGAGIYYGEANQLVDDAGRFHTGPPLSLQNNLAQPREISSLLVDQGFPALSATSNINNINVAPDYQPTLTTAQWFFDFQRNLPGGTLLTLGYNGTGSYHLSGNRNINTPLTPDPVVRWQDRTIRPAFVQVLLSENRLNASYNSFTAKAEKRFSRGFTFLSAFTYAHNIDYASTPGNMRTAYDASLDRGNSDLDRRMAYSLSFLYELPFGKGKTWFHSGPANWILGGWQVGSIVSLLSGMTVDHSITTDNQNTGGAVRGDYVRSPNLPGSQRSIDHWFDTSFVVPSAPGVIGNAGRNLIYGPGRRNLDFVASRDMRMPWEGQSLQFRFEAFNFTNTPAFGNPNAAVGNPAVGAINSAGEPRRIQFGLKYVF